MHIGTRIYQSPEPPKENVKETAYFEKVSKYKDIEIDAPIRKTEKSAGYDMVAASDIVIPSYWTLMQNFNSKVYSAYGSEIPSNFGLTEMAQLTKTFNCKPTLIPTGYKAYLPERTSLNLVIRSSSPLKYWIVLANSVGIIDGDYVDNPDNEGEIFFQVINLSPFDIKINKGEIIGQGIITPFEVTKEDALQEKKARIAGFGSTDD